MLKKEIIRPSSSPWAAPAILVPKKSESGKPKFRFCVDFRALNAVTKFDSYPLPRFDETTSTLFGSKYFTVLDCYSCFWQVNIKEEHKERTAFTVPSGHYEFNRLPFGLSNSPSDFQRLMDVLKNLGRRTQQTRRYSNAQQLPRQSHNSSGTKERRLLHETDPGSHSSKSEFFLDDDGAVYRRQQNGNHQVVLPETLTKSLDITTTPSSWHTQQYSELII
jgi:hypothetical protein